MVLLFVGSIDVGASVEGEFVTITCMFGKVLSTDTLTVGFPVSFMYDSAVDHRVSAKPTLCTTIYMTITWIAEYPLNEGMSSAIPVMMRDAIHGLSMPLLELPIMEPSWEVTTIVSNVVYPIILEVTIIIPVLKI